MPVRLLFDVDDDGRPEPHVRVLTVEHHEVAVGERERAVPVPLDRQVTSPIAPFVYPCHTPTIDERHLTLVV